MNKVTLKEFDKTINELPKTNDTVSTFSSVSVKELRKAVERFEYVPSFNELLEENNRLNLELSGYREAILRDDELLGLKSRIDKAIEYIKLGKTFENKETAKIVQMLQNDLLNILNGGDKE